MGKSEKQIKSSYKILKVLFITFIMLITGTIIYQFWPTHQKIPSDTIPLQKVSQPRITPQPEQEKKPSITFAHGVVSEPSVTTESGIVGKPGIVPKPSAVLLPTQVPEIYDFNKLEKDKALQARMDSRKQAYGVEKGIDMVVKPDETIKVGDVVVPMREIEEQIHLKRGEIVESDIPAQNDSILTPEEKKRLSDQINRREREFKEMEQQLRKLATSENTAQYLEIETGYKELSQTVRMAGTYRQITADIEKKTRAAEQDRANKKGQSKDTLAALQAQKSKLEKALQRRLALEEPFDAEAEEYGIYIVRPEDNIWNIHFRFLNGYFEKKGVAISPLADEPIKSGVSSGVGKLLKFSENMVYIYNLDKRKLDFNLNQLTPFKRIVIYNMKRVFELLEQIDYQNVNQIHFDGEALWIIRDQ